MDKKEKLERMHWMSFLQVSIKKLASFLFQNNHNTFSAFNQNMMKPILQLCKLVVNYVGGITSFWCSFNLGKHGIKGLNCCSRLSSPPESQFNCFRCLVKRSTWCFWNVFHSKREWTRVSRLSNLSIAAFWILMLAIFFMNESTQLHEYSQRSSNLA